MEMVPMQSIFVFFIFVGINFGLSSARSHSYPAFFMNSNGGAKKIQRNEIYKIPGNYKEAEDLEKLQYILR